MNGLPYYKAYPRDFIEGTVGMSFELKGAYRLILDLIYMQDGNLPDDDRYIAGLLSLSVRKWKSLRGELLSRGKIEVSGKFLTNYRAVIELENTAKLRDKMAENRRGPNKNNGINSPKFDHTEAAAEADTNNTLSSVLGAPAQMDFDILQGKLIAAAGENGIQPHGAFVVGPIFELIASGISLEADIIPTIRSVASRIKRPAGSWSYFIPAIKEAYERRVAAGKSIPRPTEEFKAGTMMKSPDGKTFVPTTEARWGQRVSAWRSGTEWSVVEWGPAPGQAGCNVPSKFLQQDRSAA